MKEIIIYILSAIGSLLLIFLLIGKIIKYEADQLEKKHQQRLNQKPLTEQQKYRMRLAHNIEKLIWRETK